MSGYEDIISGVGQGAANAMQGYAALASSKKEAKEAKRKTLANLLKQSLNRSQGIFKTGKNYKNEMKDYQAQLMQDIARNFVGASKKRG